MRFTVTLCAAGIAAILSATAAQAQSRPGQYGGGFIEYLVTGGGTVRAPAGGRALRDENARRARGNAKKRGHGNRSRKDRRSAHTRARANSGSNARARPAANARQLSCDALTIVGGDRSTVRTAAAGSTLPTA